MRTHGRSGQALLSSVQVVLPLGLETNFSVTIGLLECCLLLLPHANCC